MVKIYGSELCPDCIECKYNLDKNKIDYEYVDINKNLKNLKEFLKLRDTDPVFKGIIGSGSIGIPTLILDDGSVTLDWESFFVNKGLGVLHPSQEGSACGIDGKGC